MSSSQSVGISRWQLGLGAFTGALIYFTDASKRHNLQNYLYHTISNVLSELGNVHIILLIGVLIVSFFRINHSFLNLTSGLASAFTKSTINIIFLLLRCVSALKLIIVVTRHLIRTRRMTILENNCELLIRQCEQPIHALENQCVICLEELFDKTSSKSELSCNSKGKTLKKNIILDCHHILHVECFKQWYLNSDTCPHCRSKVNF
ncbi:unnamed protein product [Pichia kudriavzevii]